MTLFGIAIGVGMTVVLGIAINNIAIGIGTGIFFGYVFNNEWNI